MHAGKSCPSCIARFLERVHVNACEDRSVTFTHTCMQDLTRSSDDVTTHACRCTPHVSRDFLNGCGPVHVLVASFEPTCANDVTRASFCMRVHPGAPLPSPGRNPLHVRFVSSQVHPGGVRWACSVSVKPSWTRVRPMMSDSFHLCVKIDSVRARPGAILQS
jgi:hypothetical protein